MIIKTIIFLLIFFTIVNSKEFTIASYNVENLFDLTHNKSEYNEYIPNTKSLWNKKNYKIHKNNIIKINSKRISRNIYEYILRINYKTFSIFNNHLTSKKQ